jgi:hypothetical protein
MRELLLIPVLTFLIGLALVAFFLVMNVFFGGRITRTRQIAELMPGRSFLVGVVNAVFFTAIALLLFALGDQRRGAQIFGLIGIVVLIPLFISIIFGLAAMVRLTGDRLVSRLAEPWRTVVSTIVLTLACELPFVGWFGLFPFLCLYGLGAFVIGLFYRQKIEEVEEVEAMQE